MSRDATLLRALGTRRLAVSIFNTVVGAGIFVLPATVYGLAGAGAPFAYIACTIAILFVALSFASAGSRVTEAGGAYSYVGAGLGPWAGGVTGILQWLSDTLSNASVATAFAAAVGVYWPAVSAGVGRLLLLVVVIGALATLNLRGIRRSTTFLEAVTVAKLAPLLLLVALGLSALPGRVDVPPLPDLDTLGRTALVLLFAFAGIESALALSGEVERPEHTIPRALLAALLGISLLYLLIHFVAVAALGDRLSSASAAPLAAAGGAIGGPWLRQVMLAGTAISMFGYLTALSTATPRLLYSMGARGLLPAALAHVNPTHRTPSVAIVTQAVIIVAVASTGSFAVLAPMASVAILTVYALVCVAAWRLQTIAPGQGRFTVPAWVPLAAIAVLLWMLANATLKELAIEGAVIAGASLLYWSRRR
jgi:amino acid transporter